MSALVGKEATLPAEGTNSSIRSRSRTRKPSELLARRQQLLSASEFVNGNGLTSLGPESARDELAGSYEGRRARAQRASTNEQSSTETGSYRAASISTSVEAKLEDLSEKLKSHQTESNQAESSPAKSIEDVYILLAKKEKDLQLAAELGKVLLEKNEELSKANERITEDYSRKLELLEQDKHRLKRRLDLLDSEYENRLIELQTDCNILKNQLDEQQQVARKAEKEKSKLIDDLAQQNQRLTNELIEATKSEELLSGQLEQMNERFNVRLSNRQDHVAQLDALKEEIQIVNQRKQDLERRLKLANNDKAKLSGVLEDSGDKIVHLENLLNERDAKLAELADETNELRDSSLWLASELESMISLNEKLAQEEPNWAVEELSASQRKRSQLVDQLKELRLRNQSRLKANEFMQINRRRAQSGSGQTALAAERRRLKRRRDNSLLHELESGSSERPGSVNDQETDQEDGAARAETPEWREQLASEIYGLLRTFQVNLQQRKDALLAGSSQASTFSASQHLYSPNSTADDSGISTDDDKSAAGLDQVQDPVAWRRMLDSLRSLFEEMLMIGERADYEQLQKLHAKLCDQMRKKDDELLALTASQIEREARLSALEERLAILSDDLSNCDKPKEEIVKLAWRARDEAVDRKNAAEIALAKTRVENMQIASQLMEVVQQKGELSQKLAQFEDDIHYITQHSVKAKFTWEEYAEKLRRAKSAQPDSTSNLNPFAQLLSFSSSKDTNTNNLPFKSAAMDNLSQPVSLMRNFTSNAKFSLKFWQRNPPVVEKTATSTPPAVTTTNDGN